MKALRLTNGQLEDILFEESERFELIDTGEWTQDGKCQYCTFRFRDGVTGLIYGGFVGRSGSPFTGWIYNSESYEDSHTLKPIVEVEVIKINYKEVEDSQITETELVKEI